MAFFSQMFEKDVPKKSQNEAYLRGESLKDQEDVDHVKQLGRKEIAGSKFIEEYKGVNQQLHEELAEQYKFKSDPMYGLSKQQITQRHKLLLNEYQMKKIRKKATEKIEKKQKKIKRDERLSKEETMRQILLQEIEEGKVQKKLEKQQRKEEKAKRRAERKLRKEERRKNREEGEKEEEKEGKRGMKRSRSKDRKDDKDRDRDQVGERKERHRGNGDRERSRERYRVKKSGERKSKERKSKDRYDRYERDNRHEHRRNRSRQTKSRSRSRSPLRKAEPSQPQQEKHKLPQQIPQQQHVKEEDYKKILSKNEVSPHRSKEDIKMKEPVSDMQYYNSSGGDEDLSISKRRRKMAKKLLKHGGVFHPKGRFSAARLIVENGLKSGAALEEEERKKQKNGNKQHEEKDDDDRRFEAKKRMQDERRHTARFDLPRKRYKVSTVRTKDEQEAVLRQMQAAAKVHDTSRKERVTKLDKRESEQEKEDDEQMQDITKSGGEARFLSQVKSDLFVAHDDSLADRINQNRNSRLKGRLERFGM